MTAAEARGVRPRGALELFLRKDCLERLGRLSRGRQDAVAMTRVRTRGADRASRDYWDRADTAVAGGRDRRCERAVALGRHRALGPDERRRPRARERSERRRPGRHLHVVVERDGVLDWRRQRARRCEMARSPAGRRSAPLAAGVFSAATAAAAAVRHRVASEGRGRRDASERLIRRDEARDLGGAAVCRKRAPLPTRV